MIDGTDLDLLYSVLARVELPLDTAALALRDSFSSSVRRFDFACALSVLLSERTLLPNPAIRLSALYILHDLYESVPADAHPFLSTFLDYITPDMKGPSRTGEGTRGLDVTNCERYLVSRLLVEPKGAREELSRCSPKQLLMQLDVSRISQTLSDQQVLAALTSLRQCADKFYAAAATTDGVFAIPMSEDPADPTVEEALVAAKDLFSGARTDGEQLDLLGFAPPFSVPPPGILLPALEEVLWLDPPEVMHRIEWDFSMCQTVARKDEVRRLMSMALKGPLSLVQLQSVIGALEADPNMVNSCGLSPQNLPDLVENNPNLAVESLLRLMGTPRQQEYLKVLVTINMSLHSLEVVNRLANAVTLPPDFLHMYIVHCIGTCESIRDRYMQNRQVRLVCVFLQSLIRNRTISITDFFVEIQAFCIQFSRIREAAGLFRLLKKEAEQGGQG
ncbi:uncharacterized protein SPPG_07221 [Spizellomyces punctatus DAOM BR117]|uniref:CCR4-NOT transcription complex subunit 11 n=1 Tax=Spizellomyces punctatus (strain DAOM BR117) TaxID=645134 RepID=A0A0L0H8J2_SPIPD|nr:uncharacterized protein SPPG_07221 [Spizellomyces punctatus DAOM BR117]KNC97291.1 hypothetical protein SPPG_07221 [Spizellomyces punctatus DAOM BR117]|eukprot:XP_016605331.1 hypothetical protein SPPG_07221 [Spizellomyces punctatus DAOM BR117]